LEELCDFWSLVQLEKFNLFNYVFRCLILLHFHQGIEGFILRCRIEVAITFLGIDAVYLIEVLQEVPRLFSEFHTASKVWQKVISSFIFIT
jgi:hypothetical protein